MRSPGLVDLQVNGYAGVDFNDAALTADALDHALEAMLRAGVTGCLPTIITAAEHDLAARLGALDAAVAASRLGPHMVPGYHLEGPFLNPNEGTRGCHPPACMVPPDPDLIARLETPLRRPILLLTLAPELPGAASLIRWATKRGKLTAIGHAAPSLAEVTEAAEAGTTLSTHLGNALPRMLPKLDNPLMAQLAEDRLTGCFIADGIHLPPFALKAMLRAKGFERSVLVTDAVCAADAPPGRYRFAGMAIERAIDGSVRVPGSGVLAGSALTLDQAVRHIVMWGFATLDDAIRLAAANPVAALARIGVAIPRGDVTWSDRLYVQRAEVGGIAVQAAEPAGV